MSNANAGGGGFQLFLCHLLFYAFKNI